MEKNKKKYLNIFISIFCYAILIVILVNYFWDIDWQRLIETDIDWEILALAGLATLGIRFIYPEIWVFILKEFGQKIDDYWGLNFIYAKAWLGRYIPGKIAWIGGKIFFGSQRGLDIKILTLGSLLESTVQVTASLALGLFIISLLTKGILGKGLTIFSIISLMMLLISVYPPLFNRVVGKAYKVIKGRKMEDIYTFKFSTLIKTFLIFCGMSVLIGVPSALICQSIVPRFDIISNFFYIVGATSLAGSIGILAVFAPSGLGVREGVLAIFFSVLFSKEAVLVILILMRLLTTIVDLVFFLISKFLLLFRVSLVPARKPPTDL
ncbi:MAG: flippase-like domain-containing protein [Deltaproteobacteria bacterium]|nr:flippase-like domain-containing protein [Deltaproteobacteria bacterium]